MALIAIRAVIDIAADTLMVRVGLALSVTVRTLEHRVIVGIGMASRTDACGSAMVRREPGVVEGGSKPARRGVTGLAGRREACRYVIGIRSALIDAFVARVAIGRNAGVVVVDVTVGASHAGMRAGQREWRVVVIKARWNPRCGGVADFALLREARRHVVRIRCPLKILQVARSAQSAGQTVVPIHVALLTLNGGVEAGERPAGLGMVEYGARP